MVSMLETGPRMVLAKYAGAKGRLTATVAALTARVAAGEIDDMGTFTVDFCGLAASRGDPCR
jgi:hypothetical protein